MATIYNHVQLGIVDAAGDITVIYPQTFAKDTVVEQKNNSYLLDNNIKSVQSFANVAGNDILTLESSTQNIEDITTSKNAATHNTLFRGKNITSLGLEEISRRISSGTFDDLYVGDYFTTSINTSLGGPETIAHVFTEFDTMYDKGDLALTKHHAVIVPMYCFKTQSVMNSVDTTVGGYKDSYMRNTTLPIYTSALLESLGNHLISHRSFLTSIINTNAKASGYLGYDGASSAGEWCDETLELLSEVNVFGSTIMSSSLYDTNIHNTQLAYFKFNPTAIVTGRGALGREKWWLNAVVTSQRFAYVDNSGIVNHGFATDNLGVRPMYLFS